MCCYKLERVGAVRIQSLHDNHVAFCINATPPPQVVQGSSATSAPGDYREEPANSLGRLFSPLSPRSDMSPALGLPMAWI